MAFKVHDCFFNLNYKSDPDENPQYSIYGCNGNALLNTNQNIQINKNSSNDWSQLIGYKFVIKKASPKMNILFSSKLVLIPRLIL